MGMIGNQLAAGVGSIAIANDSFNGNGSTTVFTLSQTVSAVTDIEVLVDNVQQSPYDSSYSVSGTTLTFSAAPSAGTNNIYVIYNHARTITTNQVVPDDGSVTTAKLHDTAVTHGKLPAGCILQVENTIKTDTFDTTSAGPIDITGLSVTITPKFATSKILIMYNVHIIGDDAGTGVTLVRRTVSSGAETTLAMGDASGSRARMQVIGDYSNNTSPSAYSGGNSSMTILDSPNTTSATMYKLQGQVLANGFRVNKTRYNTDNGNASRGVSTITAMELKQ